MRGVVRSSQVTRVDMRSRRRALRAEPLARASLAQVSLAALTGQRHNAGYALLRSMSCDLFLTAACVTVRDPRRSRGVACAPGVVRCVWVRSREPHRLNSVSIAALAGQQRDAGHWRLDHISSGGSATSAVAAAWRRLGGTRCMLPGCRGCMSQRGRPRYALVNSVLESQ